MKNLIDTYFVSTLFSIIERVFGKWFACYSYFNYRFFHQTRTIDILYVEAFRSCANHLSSSDVRTNPFDNESCKSTRTGSRKCRGGVTTTRLIDLTLPLLTRGPSYAIVWCVTAVRMKWKNSLFEILIIFLVHVARTNVFLKLAGRKAFQPEITFYPSVVCDSDDSLIKSMFDSRRLVKSRIIKTSLINIIWMHFGNCSMKRCESC